MKIHILSKNNFFILGVVDVFLNLFEKNNFKKPIFKNEKNKFFIQEKADLLVIDTSDSVTLNFTDNFKLTKSIVNVFLIGRFEIKDCFFIKNTTWFNKVNFEHCEMSLYKEINEILKNSFYKCNCYYLNEKNNHEMRSVTLTDNEKKVIKYYIGGMSGKEIARALNKSEKTISSQKRNAMIKLGVGNNNDLVRVFSEKTNLSTLI